MLPDTASKFYFLLTRPVSLSVIAVIFVVLVSSLDVILRARSSYLKAEQYMEWHKNPHLKKQALDQEFEAKKQKLIRQQRRGSVNSKDVAARLEALEFDRQFQLEESDLKYAYQWYRDTYVLFSPPQTWWTKQAREKAEKALSLWKQELREKNIPFNEIQLR